jgi:hypothetical protein
MITAEEKGVFVRTRFKELRYLIPITIILLAVIYYCLTHGSVEPSPLSFNIKSDGAAQTITYWESEDNTRYVFLPSYADLSRVTAHVHISNAVYIGGILITDGMNMSQFSFGETYSMEICNSRHSEPYRIQFLQSANVATMYLEMESGSLKQINEDKEYKAAVQVALFDADGTLNYSGSSDTLKGRGNTTWNRDKKPYSLTLSTESDLLGMGSASKWVLLSNPCDETNLRNKIVYDLAGKTGLEWTPECAYADVYLNGEYNGLYLLAEQIEIGEDRLDIDVTQGAFLCKFDLESRQATLDNPFLTDYGRMVEINSPDVLTDEQKKQISEKVQSLEDAILFEKADGGKDLFDIIDIDSWVRRYLVDEITENIDADSVSSYFYYVQDVFYGGPIWDYDYTFGNGMHNNNNPYVFLAKRKTYYDALYQNKLFYSRIAELYQSEFHPLVENLVNSDIKQLAEEIENATRMNSLRWRTMFDKQLVSPVDDFTELIDYIRKRIEFLDSAWIDGVKYCTVKIEASAGNWYKYYTVVCGKTFTELPDAESSGIAGAFWCDKATGEAFDAGQRITRDMILVLDEKTAEAVTEETTVTIRTPIEYIKTHIIELLCFASMGLLGLTFFTFIWIDVSHGKSKRKGR